MAFFTFCDNKGCRKSMAPVIDKETNKVYCTECGKEINTVDQFMKRQMVSLGQVHRAEKRKLAWSAKCNECGKEGPPMLDKEGKELICSYCNKPMTGLNRPFAQMVKENLRAQRKVQNNS
jgi:ribosomal protein L34E